MYRFQLGNAGRSLLFGAAVSFLVSGPALAVEGGVSLHLPGIQGPMAGFVPPPGFYGTETFYYFEGDAEAAPLGGRATLKVDTTFAINILQGTYVAPIEAFGGSPGLTVAVPIGYAKLKGELDAASFGIGASTDDLDIADIVVAPLIGWHAGEFHWNASVTGYIPSGSYDKSQILNLSLNRYALDPQLGLTWFNMTSLVELSGIVGYTINFENPATDYNSGDELHLELAAIKHFESGFALGAVFFGNWQTTGDSGSGATLGSFKGQTMGAGPSLSYDVKIGDVKFNASGRYYHEFDVEKRFEGDAGFFQASFKF